MQDYSNRIGETVKAKNGQMMTIIAYRSAKDIDIRFEDGTVVYNKFYGNFKNGVIKNNTIHAPNFKDRNNKTVIATNGQKMTVIAYRGLYDIDIEFEDGTIVEHKSYANFKRGKIDNPNFFKNKYLGEEHIANNGQKMKIINFNGVRDIDVEFEDGTIVRHKQYYTFKKGEIKNPNCPHLRVKHKIGEIALSNNGQYMEIVRFKDAHDIDVKFEDGTIVSNKEYRSFKKGGIANPNFNLENYHGFNLRKVFRYNNIYYEVYNNDNFIAISTLQEISKMKEVI